jgi:hypothetical protein
VSKVDLHTHSTASDGEHSPSELVEMASSLGLVAFAVSDHDTLSGIPEAHRAAESAGLPLVPAVELSVDLAGGGSAHLLGYFPGADVEGLCSPRTPLGRALESVRRARYARNPRILEKLAGMGMHVPGPEVARAAGKGVVGRPHIAAVMVSRGYVGSEREAFDRFLARGRPAYVERQRLSADRAIRLIRDESGLPVLAHPGLLPRQPEEISALIRSLADRGMAGVEVYYPGHDAPMTAHLESTARQCGLAASGGTDYHGECSAVRLGGEGSFAVHADMVSEFLQLCSIEPVMKG